MKGWKTEKACHYVVVIFEADNIKRWKEYTEELYKKDPNDLDNHEGVITHLKPDILEHEVKWTWRTSLRTKLEEVMESQFSYFKS